MLPCTQIAAPVTHSSPTRRSISVTGDGKIDHPRKKSEDSLATRLHKKTQATPSAPLQGQKEDEATQRQRAMQFNKDSPPPDEDMNESQVGGGLGSWDRTDLHPHIIEHPTDANSDV